MIYCGDNLEQLKKLPDGCIDLIYIDPPFNSNRNYEVFWGEAKEMRSFEDRHESTQAYIEFMRPRCVELARVLKKTGSFYYHCDWHASHDIVKTSMKGEEEIKIGDAVSSTGLEADTGIVPASSSHRAASLTSGDAYFNDAISITKRYFTSLRSIRS